MGHEDCNAKKLTVQDLILPPLQDRRRFIKTLAISGLTLAACAAILGSYLGVWMSLVAGDRAPLGIAQTLCSLTPIFILPCVVVAYKERVSARAVIGAFVAVAGSALLFLRFE